MISINGIVSDKKVAGQITGYINSFDRGLEKTKFFSSIFPEREFTKKEALNYMVASGIVSDTLLGRIQAELIFQFGVEGDGDNSGGGQAY